MPCRLPQKKPPIVLVTLTWTESLPPCLILDCYAALSVDEPSPLTEAQTALADYDGDGKITLQDSIQVLVHGDYLAYDVNLDGVVDAKDAELAAEAYTTFQKEHTC